MKLTPNVNDRVSDAARRLAEEFSEAVPPETIEAIIEDSVARWADAPVQAYVPVLVERAARQRLRELAGAQRAG
ncbi:MAG: hypothetical protein NVSMB57_10730 [Actinomycetota bacterium]